MGRETLVQLAGADNINEKNRPVGRFYVLICWQPIKMGKLL